VAALRRIPGSFRDPAGSVYSSDGRVFRILSPAAASQFEACRHVLRDLASRGVLVDFAERTSSELGIEVDKGTLVLEHPVVGPWTHPYEWSFALLRESALFHLDLHLELLDKGFTLSDASAYNIQFVNSAPIFIDHLSVRPYSEGEFWTGHTQFCQQFLNPLLLRSYFDIPHNSWYRGNLEGIPTDALAKMLPFKRRLSWKVLANVILPAHFQKGTTSDREIAFSKRERRLPLKGLIGMLTQLRRWIEGLTPANISPTTWANYAATTTYDDHEASQKKEFVASFVAEAKPDLMIDLGCNTGDYSKVSLENGAKRVVGFDFDQQSLDQAYHRAKREKLNFLPLYLDAMNPSPSQGWLQIERAGFAERFRADAVLALAFEHHLAIARNAPLDQVANWLSSLAPKGVIEFVPKSDPTVVKMLALRDDIFPDYSLESFLVHLSKVARTVKCQQVSRAGRTMIWFEDATGSVE